MEIGPISGIRPVQPVQADRTAGDLSGVFHIEFQREQQDSYQSGGEGAGRGLEGEEDELAAQDEPEESESLQTQAPPEDRGRQVSFFA